MQAYKLEGRIEDSEAHGQVLLERYRATPYESGKPVRSAKFKMRETGSSLLWIHKRLTEVEATDIKDFIAERLLSVLADAESMPLTLASKLSKAKSEFFESKLFEPVREAARQKQKAVEVREADAIWRLADATHLVLEAAQKSESCVVPNSNVASVQASLSKVRTISQAPTHAPPVENSKSDRLEDALVAIKAVRDAALGGRYGHQMFPLGKKRLLLCKDCQPVWLCLIWGFKGAVIRHPFQRAGSPRAPYRWTHQLRQQKCGP